MRHYLWGLRVLTHAKLSHSGAWSSIPPFIKPSLDQEGQHVQGCCRAVYGLFAGENFYVHRRRDMRPLNLTALQSGNANFALTSANESSQHSTLLPSLGTGKAFNFCQTGECQLLPYLGFNLHFLATAETECLFMFRAISRSLL